MATAYPGGLRKRGGLLDYEDTIKPTPRNPFLGGVADLLDQAYKLPEMPRLGVPGLDFVAANRNRLMDMLDIGSVQKTAEAMAYGNRLGTGRGMTYQPLPETMGAAMAVAPMVAPAARMVGEGVAATGRFVAPKAGQLAEEYMVKTGGILPLDVYHGSPHTFPPTERNPLGEFDASKIGTGEGAQVYGHGIYVAEAPAVAKQYADNVKDMASITNMNAELSRLVKVMDADSAGGYRKFKSNVGETAAQQYDDLINKRNGVSTAEGNLYKVDLPDEKIAQMLDFDKPLSEQSQSVQNFALKNAKLLAKELKFYQANPLNKGNLKTIYDMHGADLMNILKRAGNPKQIAMTMRESGIPGIKYFDEMSRSGGEGTRNFVVFPGEEKNMTILERNAQLAEELKRRQMRGLLAP